jgi:hypothetical protein
MRYWRPAFLIFGIVAVVMAIALYALRPLFEALSVPEVPLPPLLADLKSKGGSQEFDARIKERFPLGSSQADMFAELQQLGTWEVYPHEARHYQRGFPCSERWWVTWQAGDKGELTDV